MGAKRRRGDILEITPGFVNPSLTPIVRDRIGEQHTMSNFKKFKRILEIPKMENNPTCPKGPK